MVPSSNLASSTEETTFTFSFEFVISIARFITKRSPIKNGLQTSQIFFSSNVLTVISGPIPAGSPSGIQIIGLSILPTNFLLLLWKVYLGRLP